MMMDTSKLGFGQYEEKIDCKDFSQVLQIDAVKSEPSEIGVFTKCENHWDDSSPETGSVNHDHSYATRHSLQQIVYHDHNYATHYSYQEQFEEKLNAKNLDPKYSEHSKLFEILSSGTCETVQIKNEDIDIFHEDIKRETGEEKSNQSVRLCEVCSQSCDRDVSKSTCYCSCQNENDSLFYNTPSEDMKVDVELSSQGLIADLGLKSLEVQDEIISGEITKEQESPAALLRLSMHPSENGNGMKSSRMRTLKPQGDMISGDEVTKEQDSSPVPWRLSVPSEADANKIKHTFCSQPLENYLSVKYQMKHMTVKLIRMDNLNLHERGCADKKQPFRCKICSKAFTKSGSLKIHGRVHTGEKPFHCKTCSKTFIKSGSLKIHVRIHTGEKPFLCKICSKSFRQLSHLKCHERMHNGEKQFHCKTCPKTFANSGHLKTHVRIHTGEKPFHCKICSKCFRHPSHLKCHERIHSGEKPFHCNVCSKSFSYKSSLNTHERIHTGENPFYCKICSKSFTRKRSLKAHEMRHIRENTFHCRFCSKSFIREKII